MAIKITDECINCGACEPECPNNAIYEGALEWRFSEGTDLSGKIITPNGNKYDADEAQEPVDYDVYQNATHYCLDKASEQKLQKQRKFTYMIGGPAVFWAGTQLKNPMAKAFVMALGVACTLTHFAQYKAVENAPYRE